jgi:hypothetical protein
MVGIHQPTYESLTIINWIGVPCDQTLCLQDLQLRHPYLKNDFKIILRGFAVFARLHFPSNYRIGQISLCLSQAGISSLAQCYTSLLDPLVSYEEN